VLGAALEVVGPCAGALEESANGDLALRSRGWLFADTVAARFVAKPS